MRKSSHILEQKHIEDGEKCMTCMSMLTVYLPQKSGELSKNDDNNSDIAR